MARAIFFALALLCATAICHGREMKGIKIVNDPTSPIFSSATSGGINIAGKGVAVANARTITPVKNVNKATGAIETSLVNAEGSALSVGKIPEATVAIRTRENADGSLNTTVATLATALFDKPKLSAVEANIEQKEVDAGFFAGPELKVIAVSEAKVSAEQAEKKAPSGVIISALTNATVDPLTMTASAKQRTFVSDFATTVKNPIPHASQNQTTFGQVTAIDKNGTIVFQNTTP